MRPTGLGAEVEVIPAHQVNQAFEQVLASDVRYRFVVDAATFKATSGARPIPSSAALVACLKP